VKFAGCNCDVGMTYHALNCPTSPGKFQNLPEWAKRSAATRSVAKAHESPGTQKPRTSGAKRSGERGD